VNFVIIIFKLLFFKEISFPALICLIVFQFWILKMVQWVGITYQADFLPIFGEKLQNIAKIGEIWLN